MKHVISKAGLVPTETLIKRLGKVGLAAGFGRSATASYGTK